MYHSTKNTDLIQFPQVKSLLVTIRSVPRGPRVLTQLGNNEVALQVVANEHQFSHGLVRMWRRRRVAMLVSRSMVVAV